MSVQEKRNKEQLKGSIEERVRKEEHAHRIVERLVLTDVAELHFFVSAGRFITVSQYKDVVEERAITNLCGYPLCKQTLTQVPKQKYKISLKEKKVYDITERKNFCSNKCYKASKYYESQLPAEPVWMRNEKKPVEELKLYSEEGSGSLNEEWTGTEQHISFGNRTKNTHDKPADVVYRDNENVDDDDDAVGDDGGGNGDDGGDGGLRNSEEDDSDNNDNFKKIGDDDSFNNLIDNVSRRTTSSRYEDNKIPHSGTNNIRHQQHIDSDEDANDSDDIDNDGDSNVIPKANCKMETKLQCTDVMKLNKTQLAGTRIQHSDSTSSEDLKNNIRTKTRSEKRFSSNNNEKKAQKQTILLECVKECRVQQDKPESLKMDSSRSRSGEHCSSDSWDIDVNRCKDETKAMATVENVYTILCEWCTNKTTSYIADQILQAGENKDFDASVLETEETIGKSLSAKKKILLPSIHSKNPMTIRGKIVSDKLRKAINPIVAKLGLTFHNIFSEITNILRTLSFTGTNIVLKPAEWTLVGFTMIFTLMNYVPSLHSLLTTQHEPLHLLLNHANVTKEEMERLVNIFINCDKDKPQEFDMEELD